MPASASSCFPPSTPTTCWRSSQTSSGRWKCCGGQVTLSAFECLSWPGAVMDFELDHLFVCVSEGGGPEADGLGRLGLAEGEPNTHPRQGTACRRFVFANAFLELVWVSNPAEAQAEQTRRLGLWERWAGRSAGTCPFGVCLRPSGEGVDTPPFLAWRYRPSYLPEPLCFHVGMD